MKRMLLVLAFVVIAGPAFAQGEALHLAQPEIKPVITDYHVSRVHADIDEIHVFIEVKANTGEAKSKVYDGDLARLLIAIINTADHTTVSAANQLLGFLVQDGVIPAGTVTGTPVTPADVQADMAAKAAAAAAAAAQQQGGGGQ